MGQPNLQITPDRTACARYGLNVGDVGAIVQAAIGGQAVTQVLDGDRRFDLVVRWKPEYRESLDAVRQIRVNLPSGGQIPLDQVANIETAEGASFIYREALQRYVPVRFSVRDRDLQSTVVDAKRRIAKEVHLPEGVHLEWSGEYGELQAANRRFAIVVPFALLLIAGVLYAATQSLIDTFIIMAQIPVACLGGVLALIITGTPFSVSAGVGFISIFGIAVMDGILLSFYIRRLWEEGNPFVESIITGSDRRLARHDDDRPGGRTWSAACGDLDANRRSDAAAAGDRRDRRRAGDHDADANPAAGVDLSVPSPPALRRSEPRAHDAGDRNRSDRPDPETSLAARANRGKRARGGSPRWNSRCSRAATACSKRRVSTISAASTSPTFPTAVSTGAIPAATSKR